MISEASATSRIPWLSNFKLYVFDDVGNFRNQGILRVSWTLDILILEAPPYFLLNILKCSQVLLKYNLCATIHEFHILKPITFFKSKIFY